MNKYIQNVKMLKFPSYIEDNLQIGHVEVEGLNVYPKFLVKKSWGMRTGKLMDYGMMAG